MYFDRDEIGRNLARANTLVENSGRVIKGQIALIERFKHNAQINEAAENLLETFISVYVLWHGRRDSIAKRLSALDETS
jgi:hypothetical protein